MTQKLPLFPLSTVLFPGAPLPLSIFEERYRLMIGRCIEQNTSFGVLLIRDGTEIDPNDPWVRQQRALLGEEEAFEETPAVVTATIGTTARINGGVRLEDGRYFLDTVGDRRFRLQYLIQRAPYLVGSVAYLPEEAGTDVLEPANQLRDIYTRYQASLTAATGVELQMETPPDDPIRLTYWLAHQLQVDNDHKQRWLEADVATRLREMTALLRAEIALLPSIGDDDTRRWSGPGTWN